MATEVVVMSGALCCYWTCLLVEWNSDSKDPSFYRDHAKILFYV